MLGLVNDLLVASSSYVELVVPAEVLLISDDVLADRSHRFSTGLVCCSTLLSRSADARPRLSFRGRSVGPTFRADLRKSLLVHLKLPVEEDTVLVGDSDLGACGGSERAVVDSGVLDLVVVVLVGVFDLDLSDLGKAVALMEPLRASGAAFGGVVSLGLIVLPSDGSGSLLAVTADAFELELPLVYRLV